MRELLWALSKQKTPELRGEDFEPPRPPENLKPPPPNRRRRRDKPRRSTVQATTLPIPAPGRIVTAFGAKMPNGTLSKGVLYQPGHRHRSSPQPKVV